MKDMLKVLAAALIGAYIFRFLHIPIPWMLGPIFSILFLQFIYKGSLHWSPILRDLGLVIVGIAIGKQFDLSLFDNIGILLLYMLIMNIALITASFGMAYGFSKWSKLSFKSMILSTIPGGLGQIVVFAAEEKDVDLAAITYFHIVRLLLVVIIVPFMVAGHMEAKPDTPVSISIALTVFIAIAFICASAAKRIKLPVAYFLTPILISVGLQLASVDIPSVPSELMNIALLLLGSYIGLLFKPHMVRLPVRYLLAGILSSAGLLVLTYAASFLMTAVSGYSFTTSFLSTAPGGLDQMVLLADAVDADVSTVSVFQIFRLLFIFLIVMPLLRYYYSSIAEKPADSAEVL